MRAEYSFHVRHAERETTRKSEAKEYVQATQGWVYVDLLRYTVEVLSELFSTIIVVRYNHAYTTLEGDR